jgi:hypothetical protein
MDSNEPKCSLAVVSDPALDTELMHSVPPILTRKSSSNASSGDQFIASVAVCNASRHTANKHADCRDCIPPHEFEFKIEYS